MYITLALPASLKSSSFSIRRLLANLFCNASAKKKPTKNQSTQKQLNVLQWVNPLKYHRAKNGTEKNTAT